MNDDSSFVSAFRNSSPYINAHRGKTFVISFAGEAITSHNFQQHVQDMALLHGLGIRLVLIHGIRPQIETRLKRLGKESHYQDNIRITDDEALKCVKEAAGIVRVELEAWLSMGLPNTPMAGSKIRVVSGNFVTARPVGVRHGVDFCHTGQVRRIDSQAIRAQLEMGNIVIMPPIGYSPTGEVFNLTAEDVATQVAVNLNAEKLIVMMEPRLMQPLITESVHQLTTSEAESWIDDSETLSHEFKQQIKAAAKACHAGVERIHLINRLEDGALLQELFTRDGVGTLISRSPFEVLRPASINDINGILDLLKPLEEKGMLIQRSREKLETEISQYVVIERDGLVIGCVAFFPYPDCSKAELACLALHEEYRGESRGERLLNHVEVTARHKGINQIFVLTTQSLHWFREKGFIPGGLSDLPEERRKRYNPARNSKILLKLL